MSSSFPALHLCLCKVETFRASLGKSARTHVGNAGRLRQREVSISTAASVCDGKENRVFALLNNKLYARPSAPPRHSSSGRDQMQRFSKLAVIWFRSCEQFLVFCNGKMAASEAQECMDGSGFCYWERISFFYCKYLEIASNF